jgi:hypothetical protein
MTSRVIEGILAAAVVAAATAKLIEVPMMIEVFEAIGLGQWFRFLSIPWRPPANASREDDGRRTRRKG